MTVVMVVTVEAYRLHRRKRRYVPPHDRPGIGSLLVELLVLVWAMLHQNGFAWTVLDNHRR